MKVHLISLPTALMTNSFHCYLPTSFEIGMPSDAYVFILYIIFFILYQAFTDCILYDNLLIQL